MKIPLRLFLLVILSESLGHAAWARSPEETLVAYVEAVKKDGMSASVRFMHPGEMAAFREELEPEIQRRLKDSRTRQRFSSFADPYHMKQMRPFKDDADFMVSFIKWMINDGAMSVSTFQNAEVKPLGVVPEGDLRHVVARFHFSSGKQASENVTVTSMKMDGAQPMLQLLPELKQVAAFVRAPQ